MKSDGLDAAEVMQSLDDLRQQLGQLGQRIVALEQIVASQIQASRGETEGVSEEIILAISAAIAAYLGKKPRIRQIRLLGSSTWAQQGRATIQASHKLEVRHS